MARPRILDCGQKYMARPRILDCGQKYMARPKILDFGLTMQGVDVVVVAFF